MTEAALARSGEVLLLRDLPEQVGPPTVAPEFGPPASLAPAGNAAAAPNDPAAAAAWT